MNPPKRILVVDDEEMLRTLVTTILHRNGYDPAEASNADVAYGLIKSLPFDLVISDIDMPGTMNGLDLLKELRKEKNAVPVIVFTGRATPERQWLVESLGGTLLEKPFTNDQLLSEVKKKLTKT